MAFQPLRPFLDTTTGETGLILSNTVVLYSSGIIGDFSLSILELSPTGRLPRTWEGCVTGRTIMRKSNMEEVPRHGNLQ